MMALIGKSIVSKKVSTIARHAHIFPGHSSSTFALEVRDHTSRCHLAGVRTLSTHPAVNFLSSESSPCFTGDRVPCLRRYRFLCDPSRFQLQCFSKRMFADKSADSEKPPVTQAGPLSGSEPAETTTASETITTAAGTVNPDEEERKRKEAFQKRAMKWSLIAMGLSLTGAAGFAILEWGQPKIDDQGDVIRDEFSDMPVWKQFLLRAWKEVVFYEKMIKEPSREKLLPDPLKEPYHQPPYTVVLEMTGVLVHPDWTYGTGWRFKKRPGVDYFLEQLAGPYFEIVVYTNEQAFTAFPILLGLDPNGFIMYRLFRDSTRYIKGKHVKDLSYLNRDLSKTIVVEWDPNVVPGHDRNAIFLPKWTGNDDDRTLFDLEAFLKTIAASEVEDVREVLDNYKSEDDILDAFRKRQQMLREEQVKTLALQSNLHEEKERRSFLSSLVPSVFSRR